MSIHQQGRKMCKIIGDSIREYHKQYYQKNKEKLKAKNREYYRRNKEKISIKQKEYYQKNKEKIKARVKKTYDDHSKDELNYKREYYKKNKEKISAKHKEFYLKNRDKLRAKCRDYYSKNKEKKKAYDREYSKNKKEELNAYYRDYYKKNKEKINKRRKAYYDNNKQKIRSIHYKRKRKICRSCQRVLLTKLSKKNGYCVVCVPPAAWGIEIGNYEPKILIEKKGTMINKEFNDAKSDLIMIVNSADISDDNMEIQFRKNIIDWFEKFQIFALESLYQYYKENKFSPSLLNEILELVSIADLNDLDAAKIDLLRHIFTSENLEIRHGVVEGISNLNPRIAIPILEEILSKEDSVVLKKIISSYIEQLKTLIIH